MYTIGIICLKDNNLNIILHFMYKKSILMEFTAGIIILVIALVPVNISVRSYAQSQISINGAGATFPFPLIDAWRVQYQKVKPTVNINYQSIGSGGGVKQFTEKPSTLPLMLLCQSQNRNLLQVRYIYLKQLVL